MSYKEYHHLCWTEQYFIEYYNLLKEAHIFGLLGYFQSFLFKKYCDKYVVPISPCIHVNLFVRKLLKIECLRQGSVYVLF